MTKRQIILILLIALAVRLAYHQLIPAFDGSYNNGSDSGKYIWRALSILEHGEVAQVVDGELLPDFSRMPLYPYLLAGLFWLTGGENLAVVTALQAVVSSFTVFAVALIAGAFNRRWMVPAAVLASFWPALVVYASWVLTDSLFVDLFTWGLCACVWAAKRERPLPLLIVAGLLFGVAVFTRPVLMFFPYLLVPFLAYLLTAGLRLRWPRAVGLAIVPAVIILLFLVPRLVATYNEYGIPVVTTQSGNHALELVYPCLRTDPDCDRASIEQRRYRMIAAAEAGLTDSDRKNLVIMDRIQRQVALELLFDVPPYIFVLAIVDSSVRSIVQTMLYEVGDQLNQNPRYFSSFPGATFWQRMTNFLALVVSDPFMFVWAVAQLAVLLALPVQFVGLVAGLRDPAHRSLVIFLVVTAVYFLAVNLSFGNPKYGIPLNPMEIVLLIFGTQVILDWRNRGRTHGSGVERR
jgi:4-amino-4-deoxy-L-arabinose transferase-like glycosyltransferase